MVLSKTLKKARIRKKILQKEAADATNIDAKMISRFERNLDIPSSEQLARLSKFYDIEPELLVKLKTDQLIAEEAEQYAVREAEIIDLEQEEDDQITFIDLFAGIGGFHYGMHSVGAECVFASEIDKFARQTYEVNFRTGNEQLFENNFNTDITDPELDYKSIPEFDVLCAGFPCQAFSYAGHKKGFEETRGTLFFNVEEIIRAKIIQNRQNPNIRIPRVIFLENVKGLKNHDKGRTLRTIIAHLEVLGYSVQYEVLNSKHFGVPQNRERIFVVAWRPELCNAEDFYFPYGIDRSGNPIYNIDDREDLSIPTAVGDILLSDGELRTYEEDEGKSYTISDRLWDGHQRRRREHANKGNGFGYSIFKDDSPYTSTISARYYKDGSEILIDQSHLGLNPRKLHPIEAARLQGYPIDEDEFIIPVSNNQAYKQFGNSVTVNVIKAIAREISEQLL